jgi:hypothetical protein
MGKHFAAGSLITEPSYSRALIESWDAGHWSVELIPAHHRTQDSQASTIDCATPGSCTMVGWFRRDVSMAPLAMAWSGSRWVLERAVDSPGVTKAGLARLACTSGDSCVAVGGYATARGRYVTLAERRG